MQAGMGSFDFAARFAANRAATLRMTTLGVLFAKPRRGTAAVLTN
jgi:hypothetical protein